MNAKFNLIYLENSDSKCDCTVKSFCSLSNARNAMKADFEAQNKILGFPTISDMDPTYKDGDAYCNISLSTIVVSMGFDTFKWEIVPIAMEDSKATLLANIIEWNDGELAHQPLHFLNFAAIGYPLSDQTILQLLRFFDEKYGDTDQDTKDWALEYQILARNLLCCNALILDPQMLILDDCSRDLLRLLNFDQRLMYSQARMLVENKKE